MAYVPDPNDATQPTDSVIAETAQAEFRALKAKVNAIVLASGNRINVRQTVIVGDVDANGAGNCVEIGAGLACNIKGAVSNALMSFAMGFSIAGSLDVNYSVAATAAYWAALAASNTTYLAADYVDSTTTPTAKKFLVPPQYGPVFDKTRGALLNFEAADASTSMIDDFGNTWTASGNAQIDTAQFKFGTSSLLLDGAGDFINSNSFTTFGDGSWEASVWVRWNALPGVGTSQTIIAGQTAAGVGVIVALNNTAGVIKTQHYLSSDGTTHNIVAGGLGTFTAWAINTWYKIRFVYDALAGTYRTYLSNNGAAETQDYTISSTAKICNIVNLRLGRDNSATVGDFNGWMDAFFFKRCATVTTTETPAIIAPAISDNPYNWFDTTGYMMYEATVASTVAGTAPTLTAKNRLFIGEADTGAAAVNTVRTYAYQGRYVSRVAMPAAATNTAFAHNIGGWPVKQFNADIICVNSQSNYLPGQRVRNVSVFYGVGNYTIAPVWESDRNTLNFYNGGATQLVIPDKAGGAVQIVAANWNLELSVNRVG